MQPFDDPDGTFSVLVNDEEQHSKVPAISLYRPGGGSSHDDDTRQACLDYIEENGTGMRPLSAR